MTRLSFTLVAWLLIAGPLSAQAEKVKAGDCFQVELSLTVTGKQMVPLPGGKVGSESLEGTAEHNYFERVEAVEAGVVTQAIRAYTKARSTHVAAGGKHVSDLPANRRTIAIRQTADGPLHFHPEGPLSRDELELVSEHFD